MRVTIIGLGVSFFFKQQKVNFEFLFFVMKTKIAGLFCLFVCLFVFSGFRPMNGTIKLPIRKTRTCGTALTDNTLVASFIIDHFFYICSYVNIP